MLKDRFGRKHNYLRISVTNLCNLKCVYCMPDEILSGRAENKYMSVSEIYEIAKVFTDLGINKIRITGGEPFVRKEIAAIFTKLSDLPVTLAVSTNALLIDRYTELLKNCGVKNINVSLDTLNPEEFSSITKSNTLEKIFSNIILLLENDFRVKINFVVMKGINENAVIEAAGLTKNFGVEVRFIEYMPFKGNKWSAGKVYSHDEILENIRSKYNIYKIPDEPNDTSKKYGINGHAGNIGIISTITKPFCGGCNRLRLTADGKLKNCLFSKGETDLLSAYRKGEEIKQLIISGLSEKEFERGGQFESGKIENRSMVNIGG